MNLSSSFIASFLLLCTVTSASVIPTGKKTVVYRTSEEFNAHITERGTNFIEKITIDEKNDLEIFHVPAHNGLTEAHFLYDFKSASRTRSTGKPNLIQKYWAISEQVKKTLLSQKVQDFCGQFPVYRLRQYHLNSANGLGNRNAEQTRLARDLTYLPPLCSKTPFPKCTITNGVLSACCNVDNWTYEIKIRGTPHGTYWVGCKLNIRNIKMECSQWNHDYNAIICYKPKCSA